MRRQSGSSSPGNLEMEVSSYFFTNVFCDLGQIGLYVKHLALSEQSLATQGRGRKTGQEETQVTDHLPPAGHCTGWLSPCSRKQRGENYPHVTDSEETKNKE